MKSVSTKISLHLKEKKKEKTVSQFFLCCSLMPLPQWPLLRTHCLQPWHSEKYKEERQECPHSSRGFKNPEKSVILPDVQASKRLDRHEHFSCCAWPSGVLMSSDLTHGHHPCSSPERSKRYSKHRGEDRKTAPRTSGPGKQRKGFCLSPRDHTGRFQYL